MVMDFLRNYFEWEKAIEKLKNDRRIQVDRRVSDSRHFPVYSRTIERRVLPGQRRNRRRASRWGGAPAGSR